MAEMKFETDTDNARGMLLPIGIAIVLLALATLWFVHRFVRNPVKAELLQTQVYPVDFKYAHNGTLVGADQEEFATYVVTKISLEDKGDQPLFLKEVRGSYTLDGNTYVETTAIPQNQLPRLFEMFPQLKQIADSEGGQPLAPESRIDKGATAQGYAIFVYSIPQSTWDKRKAASVGLDFYHQDSVDLPLK